MHTVFDPDFHHCDLSYKYGTSLVAQTVKRLSTMWETQVRSLGWEDPLEKEMATHSSTLAWKIPWTTGAWQATIHGVAKSRTRLSDFTSTKSLLRVKEKREKAGLKLHIQKTKILASGPITSQQIDWGKVETVTDFIFLGSKITADGQCSHEIKSLLLGRKL